MVFTDVPVFMAVASTAAGSLDEVFTDDLVSLTGDAASVGAAVLSTVALIAADSVAEIVASMAAVVDSTAAVDFMAVAATEADTGKTV